MYTDMEQLAEDARALLVATADVAGEKVEIARNRLNAALGNGKTVYERIEAEALREARAVAKYLHDNPQRTIVVAAAVGAVIGLVFACGWSRRSD